MLRCPPFPLVYSFYLDYKRETRVSFFFVVCVGCRSSYVELSFFWFLRIVREDWNRHKADKRANDNPVPVLNKETKQFETKPQGEIRVGDIVKVSEGEIFPADLVFLRSGDSKAPKSCWVNTKSLDGETDNKFRQAVKVGMR